MALRSLRCGRRSARKIGTTFGASCDVPGLSVRPVLRDVSAFGAWLSTATPLPVGARFDVALTVGGRTCCLYAEVMWTRDEDDAGMGLEWIGLDGRGEASLREVLAALPASPAASGRFAYADAG